MHNRADVIGHVHVVQLAPRLHLEVELLPHPDTFLVHSNEVVAVRAGVFVPEAYGVAKLVQQGTELQTQHTDRMRLCHLK